MNSRAVEMTYSPAGAVVAAGAGSIDWCLRRQSQAFRKREEKTILKSLSCSILTNLSFRNMIIIENNETGDRYNMMLF